MIPCILLALGGNLVDGELKLLIFHFYHARCYRYWLKIKLEGGHNALIALVKLFRRVTEGCDNYFFVERSGCSRTNP